MASSPDCRRLVILLLTTAVGLAPAPAELPPLNAKVVEFARAHLGKKVGDGSCITLAIESLEHAGARSFPLDRADGDYVWGQPIAHFKDALPGDVLQFRDAEFKGKKRLPKRRWISWHYRYPHHTAIVSAVSDGGKVITVLHQNVGPKEASDDQKKLVQEGTLRTDSLQEGGWVRIYRPVASDRRSTREDQP
jgi:hypothetical protein